MSVPKQTMISLRPRVKVNPPAVLSDMGKSLAAGSANWSPKVSAFGGELPIDVLWVGASCGTARVVSTTSDEWDLARAAGSWGTATKSPFSYHTGTATRPIHLVPSSQHQVLNRLPVKSPKVAGYFAPARAVPEVSSQQSNLRLQRLSRLQAAFGFPISTLANILKRSRTQLYKWLDDKEHVELQGESFNRLNQLARLAEYWLAETSAPLASVARERLPSGQSIAELLGAPDLDEAAILRGFRYLAGLIKAKPATVTERLLERGFQRRQNELPDDD